MFYNKARVDAVKAKYRAGTRIELESLCNNEKGMPRGLRGTVIGVDDQPALLMKWDNGRTLSLLPDEDSFRTLSPEEVEAENQTQESGPKLSM